MKAHRVDSSQAEIVRALRKAGASVWLTTEVGRGAPDMVVGYKHKTFLLEAKADKGYLTSEQKDWHASWRGRSVMVVRTPQEALLAIGAV